LGVPYRRSAHVNKMLETTEVLLGCHNYEEIPLLGIEKSQSTRQESFDITLNWQGDVFEPPQE
jgi:hypothetical protein